MARFSERRRCASALGWSLVAAACLPQCVLGIRRRLIRVDLVAVTDAQQPDWVAPLLRRLPDTRLRLYCTGQLPVDAPCIQLDPVGSEEYALLRHIVDNYDSLADVTVLTPRDLPNSTEKQERLERIVQKLDSTKKQKVFQGFASDNFFPVRQVWDGPKETCGPSARPFGSWYTRFINTTDSSWSRIGCTAAALGNVFAVSSKRIRSVPLAVYQGLLQEVERCRGKGSKVVGFYIERSWAAMFADRCHKSEADDALMMSKAKPQVQPQVKPQAKPAQQVKEEPPKKSIDLVVAAYDAPLDWIDTQLKKLPGARLFLYCKGDSQDPRCIRLDNVGTEEYAFFVHLLRHYHDLADITIFTKDNMVDTGYYSPTALESLNWITNPLMNVDFRNKFHGFHARSWYPVTEKFDVFKYHASSSDGKVKELCRPSISPYGLWYKRFINPDDTNYTRMSCVAASMHGIFAVSRDRVQRVPRSRFVDLLNEVEYCRGHNAFTAGHYMERSWGPLFSDECHHDEAWANLRMGQKGLKEFNKRFESISKE